MLNDISINQNGWIYVFVNNESQQAVYFDNFQVVHTRGNILEETHYYPFGLTMKAISSRALSVGPANKNKFSDKELQSEEFSDGTSLDEYDFGARYYDPQKGRWNSLDPQADEFPNVTPYSYAANNPVLFVDKDGKFIHLILKYGINVGINIGVQMITAYMFDPDVKSWGDAWNKTSVWDAMWESAVDMIGSRSIRMAGDAIKGMFNYVGNVGLNNVTSSGLLSSGVMGIIEPIIAQRIAKVGFKGMKYALKKVGFTPDKISSALMKFANKNAPKHGTGYGKTFKPFTKDNYRDNLAIWSGKDPGNAFHAHHVFPKEFEALFKQHGIDVHKPQFLQWWPTQTHQLFAHEYQNEWRDFLSNPNNLNTKSIMSFGRNIMSNYGLSTWF